MEVVVKVPEVPVLVVAVGIEVFVVLPVLDGAALVEAVVAPQVVVV